jgi:hypothetical protein
MGSSHIEEVPMKKVLYTACAVSLLFAGNVFAADAVILPVVPNSAGTSIESMTSAAQDQGQGQAQGINFNNSFNGSAPIRYLPIPSAVSYDTQGGPAMFGRPNYEDNGPNFVSMQDMLPLLNLAALGEAEVVDNDIKMAVQMLIAVNEDEVVEPSTQRIKFSILNSNRTYDAGFTPLALVTIKADDGDDLNSLTLAVKLSRKAREIGGTKIVFIREGTFKRLSSWGVGIGFSTNYATVSSAMNGYGGVSAGGTGWSWGEAQHFSIPFITAVIGK